MSSKALSSLCLFFLSRYLGHSGWIYVTVGVGRNGRRRGAEKRSKSFPRTWNSNSGPTEDTKCKSGSWVTGPRCQPMNDQLFKFFSVTPRDRSIRSSTLKPLLYNRTNSPCAQRYVDSYIGLSLSLVVLQSSSVAFTHHSIYMHDLFL